MELVELLYIFQRENLWVELVDDAPRIQGVTERLTDDLVAAAREHRAHLIRLARSDAALDGGRWRRDLERANAPQREAWAYLAAGHQNAGLPQPCAEWLAWHDFGGLEEVNDL